MSKGGEHKRVTLTSIIQGDAGFSRFGSNILEPDAASAAPDNSSKPTTKTAKCIRIKLDLFETDSNKYPEFNYSRLLYLEKVRVYNSVGGSPSKPLQTVEKDQKAEAGEHYQWLRKH